METEPAPKPPVVLVDERILRIFERAAEKQKNVAFFMIGGVAGCVYGVLVTFLTLHR